MESLSQTRKNWACFNWLRDQKCRYQDKCKYAHNDFVPAFAHPNYKTVRCKYETPRTRCKRGHKCRHLHRNDRIVPMVGWGEGILSCQDLHGRILRVFIRAVPAEEKSNSSVYFLPNIFTPSPTQPASLAAKTSGPLFINPTDTPFPGSLQADNQKRSSALSDDDEVMRITSTMNIATLTTAAPRSPSPDLPCFIQRPIPMRPKKVDEIYG